MPYQINYTEACNNFDKIYEEAISSREPVVVNREGAEILRGDAHEPVPYLVEHQKLFGLVKTRRKRHREIDAHSVPD
ncbi:MAG: hypothetical protein RM021_020530 [Nostoc sp. EkiNYC01]|nr:hypothetical protein [Nostoc sp. EkiNYC01]